MPRAQWPLRHGRPCVGIALTLAPSGQPLARALLADTGAGSRASGFELVLDEDDCMLCGGEPGQPISLGGAYSGPFPTYLVPVRIPELGFDLELRVVGVPAPPAGFDGIACFSFLNRFHYGNFGDADCFGLED